MSREAIINEAIESIVKNDQAAAVEIAKGIGRRFGSR